MGGFVHGVLLAALLIMGTLAVAVVAGLALLHWMEGRRPYLDGRGWLLATYGAAACGIHDVLAGQAGTFTAGWVAGAAVSGYITGTRTCGQWIVVPVHLGEPEEGPT